jgi:hypothetical protein
LTDTLKCEFRQFVQRLTRSDAPNPQRRTEDIRGGFTPAANNFMRRAANAVHLPPVLWDTLTWLRHWEFDDSAAIKEYYADSTRPDSVHEPADLSPRP